MNNMKNVSKENKKSDDISLFNQEMFQFLDGSPTPFHAVQNQVNLLESCDFKLLSESDEWLK